MFHKLAFKCSESNPYLIPYEVLSLLQKKSSYINLASKHFQNFLQHRKVRICFAMKLIILTVAVTHIYCGFISVSCSTIFIRLSDKNFFISTIYNSFPPLPSFFMPRELRHFFFSTLSTVSLQFPRCIASICMMGKKNFILYHVVSRSS